MEVLYQVDFFFQLMFGWFECGNFTEIGNTIHRKLMNCEKKNYFKSDKIISRICDTFGADYSWKKNVKNLFTIPSWKWIIALIKSTLFTIFFILLEFSRAKNVKKSILNRFGYSHIFFRLYIYKYQILWHDFLNLFVRVNKSVWDETIHKYVILCSLRMSVLLKVFFFFDGICEEFGHLCNVKSWIPSLCCAIS